MIATQPQADLSAVKSRQQATWATGDYAVIGLCRDVYSESAVLDFLIVSAISALRAEIAETT